MRAGKQIRVASDKLAFVIVQQLQDMAQGRPAGHERQLADALNAYGRAVAFLEEEVVVTENASQAV